MSKLIITGGVGFIGSNLTRLAHGLGHQVLVIDRLTYAGNRSSLAGLEGQPGFAFIQADICDAEAMRRAFAEAKPEAVMRFAAESHVDRSVDGPGEFIATNVTGTFQLLQAALGYWRQLSGPPRAAFRFLHGLCRPSSSAMSGKNRSLFIGVTAYIFHETNDPITRDLSAA